MKFKIRDIIKGKKANGYGFTNEEMTKAEVVSVEEEYMRIRVLETIDGNHIGSIQLVLNTDTKFELVLKKPTKEELFKIPVGSRIHTNSTSDDWDSIYSLDADGDFKGTEEGDCIQQYEINSDLSIDGDINHRGTKIIKIEEVESRIIYDESATIKEMTVSEIKKKLGHPIKIIKEEK